MTLGSLFEKVKHLHYQCWWVEVSSCSLEGLKCRHQLWENTLLLNIIQAEGMIIDRVMNVAICFGYNLRKSNMQSRRLWQTFGGVPNLGIRHDCQVKETNNYLVKKNLMPLFEKHWFLRTVLLKWNAKAILFVSWELFTSKPIWAL